MTGARPGVSVIVVNWNGRRWLPACLAAIAEQRPGPAEVIVVDNGSRDGSIEYLRGGPAGLAVNLLELGVNTGFAHAVNRGIALSSTELVALVNTDVVLSGDWLARMTAALAAHPAAASIACKLLTMEDPPRVYDAGDILRRDGACEQRGRFALDDGRWDEPGEVFGACAGAAVYRRGALLAAGGFDERYFAYLEDVDLALALRLAGWSCWYEPVVARHAGGGSAHQLRGGPERLVARNTLILITKAFPARWLPLIAYRQCGWAWHALRERRLGPHLAALAAAVPHLPAAWRQRHRARHRARVPIEVAVPARPWRGRRAGGHPAQIAGSGAPGELTPGA